MKNNLFNDCSAGDFEKAHFSCLPDIGEIQVNGLMLFFQNLRTEQLARVQIRRGATMRKTNRRNSNPCIFSGRA
ncbi:hypothetical protein Fmac_016755 [Flemingia macrophylla]|uniref:Uncharacterized protein n=1 Tax=Flemingia macrophylla TaxID=520843 RepID=A0ABD1MIC1_9FABA